VRLSDQSLDAGYLCTNLIWRISKGYDLKTAHLQIAELGCYFMPK